jgi:hypothetical protein
MLEAFDRWFEPEVLEELRTHRDEDPARYALSHQGSSLPTRAISQQLHLRVKAGEKFPSWKNKELLYSERALEQASSERTARLKGVFFHGRVLDLCGGLGADLLFNAAHCDHVTYCDLDPQLCRLFAYNAQVLGIENYDLHCEDAISLLKRLSDSSYEVIYADPDRRTGHGRTIRLDKASPDLSPHWEMLLQKAPLVIIKASPGLDVTASERTIPHLSEFRVVSVNGEVKEILLFLSRAHQGPALRSAILCKAKSGSQDKIRDWTSADEINASPAESPSPWASEHPPLYFAEPDPAIIKAGLVGLIARTMGLAPTHKGSVYLLGSEAPVDFPGRVFRILALLPANQRHLRTWCKQHEVSAAHIACRDFPETPDALRKTLKLKDGGSTYLFFSRYGQAYRCFVGVKV